MAPMIALGGGAEMMSVIQRCESCGKETSVEAVLPGGPVKCIDCANEEPDACNGRSVWFGEPSHDDGNSNSEPDA